MDVSENIQLKRSFPSLEILPLFYEIDDFCQVFEKVWRTHQIGEGKRRRNRLPRLSQSEVMIILVLYDSSGYKNLKAFYLQEIVRLHSGGFRRLVSYNRFVELQGRCVMPLYFYLVMKRGNCT